MAESHGCKNKEDAVRYFQQQIKDGAGVVVAWGADGAACYHPDSGVTSFPAHPPSSGVVDTLGAGDTFNAATIGCLASGLSLSQSVDVGCRVAGEKVGFRGFENLKQRARDIVAEAVKDIPL